MLRKVLIANRGEIACRIMRTAKRLGMATVAVYSDGDAAALHVAQADEAVHIGASPAAQSYLRIDKIVAAAKAVDADCVHPGYGFLSENADFAKAVRAAGLTFIGPSEAAMRALGDKAAAKALAEKLAIPVVPGYGGRSQDARALAREAGAIGFPVIIKAAAGGGGRGMRVVEAAADFPAHLDSAVREATAAFGDGRVLVEKLIERPRHIEVQIFGDRHGNVVHLFERDCSLQRRHQKVIEEAPAPGMSEDLRARLTGQAVRLAKAAKYENAGTVEFLIEGGNLAPDAPFYFIEVNTRLQVEHPVTEEVTGVDLVEWQFVVAAGEPLPKQQDAIRLSGHAIEARLCAEDVGKGFLPSTGRLVKCMFTTMQGVRLETAVTSGDEVTPHYDSMIAKVIAQGASRREALDCLDAALTASRVMGPETNGHFLRALIRHQGVREGQLDTGLIARDLATLIRHGVDPASFASGIRGLLAAEVASNGQQAADSPWCAGDSFCLGSPREEWRDVVAAGARYRARIVWRSDGPEISVPGLPDAGTCATSLLPDCVVHEKKAYVLSDLGQLIVSWPIYNAGGAEGGDESGAIRAPITGRVAKVFISDGSAVAKGDRLAIVEAMKMEHVVHAPRDGIVRAVAVREGQQIAQGAVVAELGEGAGMSGEIQ